MPSRPPRFTLHTKPDRTKERDKRKGDRHQRGYGEDWTKLRNAFIQENPLCVECLKEGVTNPENIEIDHIEPISGVNDPRRLDWSNLQALCRSHHKRKTDREQR